MKKTLYNQVGEIKGKEAEDQDSFSFQFTPQNENLKRTRGSLFSLVTVKGEEKEKLSKATAFYQSFQSSYYAKSSGSIIKSLSDTLDAADENFNQKEDEKAVQYSLVAAVLWSSVLYLAKLSKGSVFIARSGKIKQLEFSKVASGVLENQDTVCLSSDIFAEHITSEELATFLENSKFEKSLEAIDKKISDVAGATCVIIRLTVDEPETSEPLEIAEIDEEGKADFPAAQESSEEKIPDSTAASEVEVPIVPSEKTKESFGEKASALLQPLQSSLGKVFENLKKPWEKREPGEHVDLVMVRRARIFQIVAVIITILISSLIIGSLGKGTKTDNKAVAFINSAKSNLTEAKNVKTIDPNRAKNLVNKAIEETASAKKVDPKNTSIPSLEAEEASLLAEITRTYRVGNLKTVFDFSSLTSNAKIARIALLETTLLASDSTNNALYSLDLDQKKGEKISTSLEAPNNLATSSSSFFVQTAKGVEKVDKVSGKISNQVTNQTWGEITGAASYQGNLYLLDRGKNQIWKYLNLSSGLSAPKAYVSEEVDLKKASAIAIDGFVWVANENGTTYKFSQGKKQEFTINNMADSFSKVVDIYTDATADNLYFLDQGKGSMTIISKKDGVYQSQYSDPKLKSATGIVVNESKKTAYFASEGKLYSFTFQ